VATVQVKTLHKLQLQVTSGSGHTFVADEPVHGGGDGAGASPYELLLSALGA
jgi:uncharacterized OsmC-like protein